MMKKTAVIRHKVRLLATKRAAPTPSAKSGRWTLATPISLRRTKTLTLKKSRAFDVLASGGTDRCGCLKVQLISCESSWIFSRAYLKIIGYVHVLEIDG